MRAPTVSIFLIIFLLSTVMAVPEIEHDKSEVDLNDCQSFTKEICRRACPRGYVGVYRGLCSAGDEQHECCAVQCCRSRHEDGNEGGHEGGHEA